MMAVVIVIIGGTDQAKAKDLVVSMAFLPDILESPDKGSFVDIIKAIDDVYEDGIILRKVYPFPRSIQNVIIGNADFHLPMIRNRIVPEESLPYSFTKVKMGDVCFVIYSRKNNPITFERIQGLKGKKPFPLKIESAGGLLIYFDFPITESIGIENSLKKINLGRTDAFIFAQEETDFTLRELKLKHIHRELYDTFDDVFLIQKGNKGKEIDTIISGCLKKLKASGKLQPLYQKVHAPFQTWQPCDMGW